MLFGRCGSRGLGGLCRFGWFFGWVLAVGTASIVAAESPPTWKADDQLLAALAEPASVTWEQTPLRAHLQQLARVHHVCIMLDRRIDPTQKICFDARDIPFGVLLERLARQVGAQVTLVESVVYMGPEAATSRLTVTLAQLQRVVKRLPRGARRRLEARRAWRWDELSIPRQLAMQLAEQGGITVEGIERIPYDLWPAGDLPATSWIGRMALVLAGFNLTFEIEANGHAIRIVDFPESLAPDAPTRRWPKLRRSIPTNHSATKLDRTRYTLTVHGHPVGAVLKTLQQRSGLVFSIDAKAAKKLSQVVKFEVREATIDQLLDAVTRPAGLTFRRQGNRVWVSSQ